MVLAAARKTASSLALCVTVISMVFLAAPLASQVRIFRHPRGRGPSIDAIARRHHKFLPSA